MQIDSPQIKLTAKKIDAILRDAGKSAEAVHLVYVKDSDPGIRRVRKGKNFFYLLGTKKISDQQELDRIKKLVIPPAWENVWICTTENGHLQATGTDLKKRKQYLYHPLWNALRNQTKFYRLQSFGEVLPGIRKQVKKDLALPGLPQEKVLALIVSLMEETNIRVGSGAYEKLYGSYGLTTLKDKHVKLSGSRLRFLFKGKKGIQHEISINNKRFARLVKQCRDIPGKELFQYYDESGGHKSIDSGMVNEYIKKISGQDFSAKDFRTWSGSVHSLLAFKSLGCEENEAGMKRTVVAMLDRVAKQLGNTRSVCKKYYVHPVIISLFEEKRLRPYFDDLGYGEEKTKAAAGLSAEEKVLMKILAKESQQIKL
jgi:DNA topoisomerase-1